jgi:hypothetical protein
VDPLYRKKIKRQCGYVKYAVNAKKVVDAPSQAGIDRMKWPGYVAAEKKTEKTKNKMPVRR